MDMPAALDEAHDHGCGVYPISIFLGARVCGRGGGTECDGGGRLRRKRMRTDVKPRAGLAFGALATYNLTPT